MVNSRSAALTLGCLVAVATAASGQQYPRPGVRGAQQPNQRQQQPQYRQQYSQQQYPQDQQYRQQSQYRQQTQQRSDDRSYSATPDQYGRQQVSSADRKIATLLAHSNKAEVKLARYALNRVEDRDVRTFADSLVQDHEQILDQLRRYVPEIASYDSASGRGYGDRDQRDRDQGDGDQRRGGQSRTARAWDDATVAQQISERLARKARDELSEKDGWELDHTFVGQQLVSHQQHIAKMEVYRQYASPELRQVIDEAIQITEGHEQEARDLAEDLGRGRQEYAEREDRRSERVSRRDRTDEDTEEAFFDSSERRETSFGEEREYGNENREEAEEDDMEADDDDRRESDDDEDEDQDDRAERDSDGRRVREREERDNRDDREE
jgi:predicted outer membrane protein